MHNLKELLFVAVFLGCTSTGRVCLWLCGSMSGNTRRLNRQWFWFLKHLRRSGNGLKSHPTDWEKPRIEPATPGLQDIGLSPTPRQLFGHAKYIHSASIAKQS